MSHNAGPEPCFSGDALVRVQGLAQPVHMRDLRTGQMVQCVDSGADLTAPATLKWCKLMNWVRVLHVWDCQAVCGAR